MLLVVWMYIAFIFSLNGTHDVDIDRESIDVCQAISRFVPFTQTT